MLGADGTMLDPTATVRFRREVPQPSPFLASQLGGKRTWSVTPATADGAPMSVADFVCALGQGETFQLNIQFGAPNRTLAGR